MMTTRSNFRPIMAIAAMMLIATLGFFGGRAFAEPPCVKTVPVAVSQPTLVFTQSCAEWTDGTVEKVGMMLLLPEGQPAFDSDIYVSFYTNEANPQLISGLTIPKGKTFGETLNRLQGLQPRDRFHAVVAQGAGGTNVVAGEPLDVLVIEAGSWPTPVTDGNCGGSTPYPAPNAADKQCKVFLPQLQH